MQDYMNNLYTMTMVHCADTNITYPVSVQIWLMDDIQEKATHVLTVHFPEWWTLEDRNDEIDRLETVYGIEA